MAGLAENAPATLASVNTMSPAAMLETVSAGLAVETEDEPPLVTEPTPPAISVACAAYWVAPVVVTVTDVPAADTGADHSSRSPLAVALLPAALVHVVAKVLVMVLTEPEPVVIGQHDKVLQET